MTESQECENFRKERDRPCGGLSSWQVCGIEFVNKKNIDSTELGMSRTSLTSAKLSRTSLTSARTINGGGFGGYKAVADVDDFDNVTTKIWRRPCGCGSTV